MARRVPASPNGARPERVKTQPDRLAKFEEYSFDLVRQVLSHRGRPVHLEPQVAELLAHLIRDAGRLIARDELKARLWPDHGGSDDALNTLVSSARRALGACPGRPLATVRGLGYRFEAALAVAEAAPERPPLFDRSQELRELRRLAERCVTSSKTRLALVTGVAGIGKTRLVEQISADWVERGNRCLTGQCLESEGSPPLWPWQCLLRDLDATHAPPKAGPALGAEPPVSRAGRYDYYVSVRAVLERAAGEGPLLVVLENLHLADDATLTLLEFLTTGVRPVPILYLATVRTPLVGPNGPAIEGFARQALSLALGPLGEQGSLRLFRSVLGDARDAALESEALRQAGGNPLFVRELAFGLKTHPGGAFEFLHAAGPSAIRDSIRWHLSALDERTRALLGVAAVLGEEFDVRWLAAALATEISSVLNQLSLAVRHELIRPLSSFACTFCHALFRQYLYDTLPELERRRHHWQIGTRMLEARHDASARGLSQVAYHLAAGAVEPREAAEAAKLGRRSADAAVERFAFETAASEYLRTLRLAEIGGVAVSERVRLMIHLSDCYRFVGRRGEASACATEAAALAQANGDGDGRVEALIARARNQFDDDVDASASMAEELQAALEETRDASARARARLLALLATSLSFTSQVARRKAAIGEALRLASAADQKTQAFVLLAHARERWGALADKALWPQMVEQAIAAARRANEPELEIEGLFLEAAATECGSLERAERSVELGLARAERLGSGLARYFAKGRAAGLAIFRGQAQAAQHCQEAWELGKSVCADLAPRVHLGQVCVLAYEFERVAEVLPQVQAVADIPPGVPVYRAVAAMGWAMLGNRPRARDVYERLLSQDCPFGESNCTLATLTVAAETCVYLGDRPRAETLYPELVPFADRLALTGIGFTILGIPSYALARLAALLEDFESAFQHAAAARDLAARFQAPRWVARCDAVVERIHARGEFEGWVPRSLTA